MFSDLITKLVIVFMGLVVTFEVWQTSQINKLVLEQALTNQTMVHIDKSMNDIIRRETSVESLALQNKSTLKEVGMRLSILESK